MPSNTDNEFYVVVGFNRESNELIVAFDQLDAPGLFTEKVELYGLSFIDEPVQSQRNLLAKPRYRDQSQEITYIPIGEKRARVIFKEPQRALAPGQILALYDGNKLLGGGFYK